MKPMIWRYQSKTKQNVTFRGRVRQFKGNKYHDYPCAEVRSNQAEAMRDAQDLLAEMNKYDKRNQI